MSFDKDKVDECTLALLYGKPSPTVQTLTVQKARDMLNNCGFKIEDAKLIGNNSKAISIIAIAV